MKTTKEKKVISLELSKKIDELAKKKGIKLKSEYCWGKPKREKAIYVLVKKIKNGHCDWDYIPALDTAELGEVIPDTINFRDKETYSWIEIGKIGNTWKVIYRVGCAKADIKITDDILAEAMGKMYFYLLDNNLL